MRKILGIGRGHYQYDNSKILEILVSYDEYWRYQIKQFSFIS